MKRLIKESPWSPFKTSKFTTHPCISTYLIKNRFFNSPSKKCKLSQGVSKGGSPFCSYPRPHLLIPKEKG